MTKCVGCVRDDIQTSKAKAVKGPAVFGFTNHGTEKIE